MKPTLLLLLLLFSFGIISVRFSRVSWFPSPEAVRTKVQAESQFWRREWLRNSRALRAFVHVKLPYFEADLS